MKTITFECEVITPMFLAGADGRTPELRPPSIKGAMRFWWRAMYGNLSLTELKKKETEIFGGGGENAGRSRFDISVHNQPLKNDIISAKPLPHHDKPFSKYAIRQGFTFNVNLSLQDNPFFNEVQLKNLFIIVSILGGLGNRSRRGFGSFKIMKINNVKFEQPTDINSIERLIKSLNPAYPFVNTNANYPFVKSIEIGKTDSNITKKIGEATHKVKGESGWKYGNAMGNARPRFSSPIYVSVIKKNDEKLYPIITSLNTVPPDGRGDVSIQKTFKKRLL